MALYDTVPKTLRENLRFRIKVLKKAANDADFRADMMKACREDVLFWLSTFCWLHEPRIMEEAGTGIQLPTTIPMIPWEHQVPIIVGIRKHIGYRDVIVQKSRAEGMSWIGLLMAIHDWLFFAGRKIGLVSSTELKADDPGNMDSIGAKCLAIDTPILTPTGWRPLRDIRPGDIVIGSSGSPTPVIGVVPPYEAELFAVTFSDGSSVTCTGDHRFPVTEQWQRMSKRRLSRPHEPFLVDVATMATKLRGKEPKHWNYQVQEIGLVVFAPAQPLPLDPYVVGALIGDGCLTQSTPRLAGIDQEIADTLSERLSGIAELRRWSGDKTWGILGGRPFLSRLEAIGLRGKRAWEKFIPDQYKHASTAERLELLRGLMDTDGHVKGNGSGGYCTTSPRLASDVIDLVRSLGGAAVVSTYTPSCVYKGERRFGRTAHRISVSLCDNPFKLTRKAEKYKPRKHTSAKRVVSVECAGRGMVSCVQVAAADHLFVADGYTLTHNCDFVLNHLPVWMAGRPKREYGRDWTKHSWDNWRNGSQINAFAATSDTGRAGRYTWFLADELAFWNRPKDQEFLNSVRGSTPSRLIVSTPNGMDGAYYKVCQNPGNAVVLRLDWKNNPVKARGLYRVIGGKPVAIDPIRNPLPKGYIDECPRIFQNLRMKGFTIDNTTRSPWYDEECGKADATPRSVAMEIDQDFGGSSFKFFFPDFFKAAEEHKRQPLIKGRFDWHQETLEKVFVQGEGEEFKLWCQLDNRQMPPMHSYALGIDIGLGEGGDLSSNSVCSILDLTTLEQVGEFATNTIEPIRFADACVSIAKWFHNAFMIWETNGPGSRFGKRILQNRYPAVYEREELLGRKSRPSGVRKVGWHSGKESKGIMLDEFRRAVITGELTVRSEAVIRECTEYFRDPATGQVSHKNAGRSDDDPDAGDQHGDRVIAMALSLQAARKRPVAAKAKEAVAVQRPDTLGWRVKQWEKQAEGAEDDWNAMGVMVG